MGLYLKGLLLTRVLYLASGRTTEVALAKGRQKNLTLHVRASESGSPRVVVHQVATPTGTFIEAAGTWKTAMPGRAG